MFYNRMIKIFFKKNNLPEVTHPAGGETSGKLFIS